MGAAEDDVVDGEIVEEVAGDDTIEAADDADGEIEDAEVIGEIGLLDPAVARLLRDTTGEIVAEAPAPESDAPLSFPRLHWRSSSRSSRSTFRRASIRASTSSTLTRRSSRRSSAGTSFCRAWASRIGPGRPSTFSFP